MSSEMPLITVGTELQDDFVIGEMIGGGYFGRIYEAYQKSLDRKVAIKFERYSENWQNDAVVLARIDANRHLPQVYTKFELWDEEGKQYVCLVMEYIEGLSLDKVVKNLTRDEWIPPERIVKWMTQLCYALDELHGKNILHMDVKPGNIMITDRGEVKLIDFNTAVINRHVGVWGLCTSNGYSPPEQYETEVTAGKKTKNEYIQAFGGSGEVKLPQIRWIPGVAAESNDIYAAGATLYFLLVKHRPASSEKRVSKEFVKERSGRVKEYAPFYQVVEKATALNPANRYSSAKELGTAVEKAYKRAMFWTRRVKILTVACIMAAMLVLTGAVYGAATLFNRDKAVEAGVFNLYEQGNQLISEGDYAGAEDIVNTHIAAFSDADAQIFIYALQAEILCAKNEYEQYLAAFHNYPDAIRFYQGKHMPFFAELLYWAGEANFYLGEYETAAGHYLKAMTTDAGQLEYKKALLRTYAVLGQTDEMERLLATLTENENTQIGDDWLYFFEGIANKEAGDNEAAETAFLKAAATKDDKLLWSVVYTCSAMYYENNDHEKQVAFLSDKQAVFPAVSARSIVSERLGVSLRKLGRLDEAIACYASLVEAQPYAYRAYELLAATQDERKLYEDEMVTLDQMIVLSPQNIRAYLMYVNALLQSEYAKPYEERDFSQAYAMFLKAEGIAKDDPDVITYRDSFSNLKINGLIED